MCADAFERLHKAGCHTRRYAVATYVHARFLHTRFVYQLFFRHLVCLLFVCIRMHSRCSVRITHSDRMIQGLRLPRARRAHARDASLFLFSIYYVSYSYSL